MKQLLFILIILSTSIQVKSQEHLEFVFNNRDDICEGRPDSGIKAYFWNNGILYLGFCYDSTDTYEGYTLTFYDTLGTLKWKKYYFDNNYQVYQGNDLIALNNHSFYIGGLIAETPANIFKRFFAKYNISGEVIFFKIYPDTLDTYLSDLDRFSGDTILLMSNRYKDTTNGSHTSATVLDKIDTTGNILYTSNLVYDLGSPKQFIIIDDRIYAGGIRPTNLPPNYMLWVFIDVYDLNFKYLGRWNPGTPNEWFAGLTKFNNELILTCIVNVPSPYPYPFNQSKIIKFSKEGAILDSKLIGLIDPDGRGAYQADFLNKDVILFPNYDSLYFLDTSFNIICRARYAYRPPDNIEMSSYFVLNKRMTGTGMLIPYNNIGTQDHWNFLSENLEEYLKRNCQVDITEQFKSVDLYNIYPNPFNSIIQVKCKNVFCEKYFVTLYNSVGDICSKLQNNGDCEINTISLPAGLYYLKIADQNGSICYKMIKAN